MIYSPELIGEIISKILTRGNYDGILVANVLKVEDDGERTWDGYQIEVMLQEDAEHEDYLFLENICDKYNMTWMYRFSSGKPETDFLGSRVIAELR